MMYPFSQNTASKDRLRFGFSFSLLLFLLIWVGCNDESTDSIPDVSHINVDLKVERFERDFFSLAELDDNQILAELEVQNLPALLVCLS